MRIVLRATVLLAWAAMMVTLYARTHPSFDAAAPPAVSPSRAGTEEWQGIFSGDKKIGYAVSRQTPTAEGFTLENDAIVRLTMMGEPRVVRTHVTADTDASLRLRRFRFRLRAGTVEFSANGSVTDRGLDVVLDSGSGRTRHLEVPLSGPVVLPQTLRALLADQTLEPGKTFRFALFDPLSGAPEPVALTVGPLETIELAGEKHPAFSVSEEFRGSRFRLWVDRDGHVLREEGPLGLVLLRESEASATEGFDREGALDVIAASAISVARVIPNPRDLGHLTLRLEGFPPNRALAFPPRQEVSGEIVRIRREDLAGLSSFALPSREEKLAKELEPTPFLESDDPGIRERAQAILGGETDARRAAEKLVRWVFDNLEKEATVSVPDAREVLASRRGDCNEHAVLLAALARAAGLPARVVAGAVYVPDETGAAGIFAYHAWDEVWLGAWTAVDPTFGQFPADATHVKFLEGGPETHAGLLSIIGHVKIEVEDFS